jgi:two-component sensor histidine kinase
MPVLAQRLAMMLHELGTNAVKYGALSTACGKVVMSWAVDDGTLRLQWMERGGPAPIAAARRGFGRMLIEKSAENDGGRANMVIDLEGITWNIAMPFASADARGGEIARS